MTYLWQEERGKKYYRVQTDDKAIAMKLKRRDGFHLCGYAVNAAPANGTRLWIFTCQFKRPDIAKDTIKSITGKKAKIDSEGCFVFG